jgi:hypothetical protein
METTHQKTKNTQALHVFYKFYQARQASDLLNNDPNVFAVLIFGMQSYQVCQSNKTIGISQKQQTDGRK